MKEAPTTELELLLLCARMDVDDDHAKRIALLLGRGVDWDGLAALAQRHGLTPLLYRTLAGLKSDRVPQETLTILRSRLESNRLRNLVFVNELVRALRALESAGVTATPYKGPALAAHLFGDAALRQVNDIDLLVRTRDVVRAQHALLQHGLVPALRMSRKPGVALVRFHNEYQFTALEGQLLVELNWRIAPWYWRLPEIPDCAWERIQRMTLAGMEVSWLSPEDLLFVLCLHGCKHHWERLKWVVDIAEMLRVHPALDWAYLMDLAYRTGSRRMIAVSVLLAHELLDASLSEDLRRAIYADPLAATLAEEVVAKLVSVQYTPIGISTRLSFLARATQRFDARVSCRALIPVYFVLHRWVRPGVAALRAQAAH